MNTPSINARFTGAVRCGLLLAGFLCATPASAERYVKISAEMEITERMWTQTSGALPQKRSAGSTNSWTISFTGTVGTNKCQLDGNFSRNARVKWFFDGTNVLNSAQITKQTPEEIATNSQIGFLFPPLESVKSNLTVNIYVTPGGHPAHSDVGANVPWLALCSGTYLKRSGRIIPLPAATINHAPDVFAYSDKTETFHDELGLPKKIELLTCERLYAASVTQFAEEANWQKKPVLSSGLPDGLVKFHYIVTASTNFLGWNLPLAFDFGEDIPSEFSGTFRARHGSGRVTAITESSEPEGVFDPSLNQTVVDTRFRSHIKEVNGIMYHTTNTFVAPKNDPALRANFAAHARRAPFTLALRRKAPVLIALGVVVLVAACLGVALLFRERT